ncbi:hypothetical protein BDV24DRAFT_169422 [Aspergillus arachidicola]|uniref:Uncharacterized protein n=1 Tax=Aspergillus arachidicola TaxID=656916 RepID=A0A5N6XPY6_9EURO|nr:hypothetical protein BDV24DRAFT_169422 [Aspergillus arachidicola]
MKTLQEELSQAKMLNDEYIEQKKEHATSVEKEQELLSEANKTIAAYAEEKERMEKELSQANETIAAYAKEKESHDRSEQIKQQVLDSTRWRHLRGIAEQQKRASVFLCQLFAQQQDRAKLLAKWSKDLSLHDLNTLDKQNMALQTYIHKHEQLMVYIDQQISAENTAFRPNLENDSEGYSLYLAAAEFLGKAGDLLIQAGQDYIKQQLAMERQRTKHNIEIVKMITEQYDDLDAVDINHGSMDAQKSGFSMQAMDTEEQDREEAKCPRQTIEEPRSAITSYCHDVSRHPGQHYGCDTEGQCVPGSERRTTSKDGENLGHEVHPGRDTGDSPTDNIVPTTTGQSVEMQPQDNVATTSDIAVNRNTLPSWDLGLKLSPPSPIPGVAMSPTNGAGTTDDPTDVPSEQTTQVTHPVEGTRFDNQQSAFSVGLDQRPIHLNPDAVADTNPTMGQPMQEFYIHPEDDNQPPSMGTENQLHCTNSQTDIPLPGEDNSMAEGRAEKKMETYPMEVADATMENLSDDILKQNSLPPATLTPQSVISTKTAIREDSEQPVKRKGRVSKVQNNKEKKGKEKEARKEGNGKEGKKNKKKEAKEKEAKEKEAKEKEAKEKEAKEKEEKNNSDNLKSEAARRITLRSGTMLKEYIKPKKPKKPKKPDKESKGPGVGVDPMEWDSRPSIDRDAKENPQGPHNSTSNSEDHQACGKPCAEAQQLPQSGNPFNLEGKLVAPINMTTTTEEGTSEEGTPSGEPQNEPFVREQGGDLKDLLHHSEAKRFSEQKLPTLPKEITDAETSHRVPPVVNGASSVDTHPGSSCVSGSSPEPKLTDTDQSLVEDQDTHSGELQRGNSIERPMVQRESSEVLRGSNQEEEMKDQPDDRLPGQEEGLPVAHMQVEKSDGGSPGPQGVGYHDQVPNIRDHEAPTEPKAGVPIKPDDSSTRKRRHGAVFTEVPNFSDWSLVRPYTEKDIRCDGEPDFKQIKLDEEKKCKSQERKHCS